MEREKLSSRLSFILLSAGCAIGIGNVWKFPYLAGQNGGGLFVLIYLLFLAILGVPVLTMEFAMGRAAAKSPVKMYQELEPAGSKWHIHGIFCLIGNVILMMFFTTVSGWMLLYFIKIASGQFSGFSPEKISDAYYAMQRDPLSMTAAMAVIVVFGFLICSFGLQGGLERVTKVMMTALLLIMIVLAVNCALLKGGSDGLVFYLRPDFSNARKAGLGNVIVNAMNQAFFTLSLGMGSMAIFGSYIGKEHSLMGESVHVAVLDTFVAIMSGLIIFPACFAYGVEPDSGPGLIFITLPNIFNNMPFGRLWGSLFFIFMTFAAFSTVLAVFENIMACVMELTGWNRRKTGVWCAAGIFLLSLPCVLGFNLLSGIHTLGPDKGIMDLEDFIVTNLMLPAGSLLFILFCTRRSGWGWDAFVREADTGRGIKIQKWMRPYMTYVLPLIVVIVLIMGLT